MITFIYLIILKWDENIINDTLLNKYKWEKSSDTDSTWRIGDGAAPFYNYIYHTMVDSQNLILLEAIK